MLRKLPVDASAGRCDFELIGGASIDDLVIDPLRLFVHGDMPIAFDILSDILQNSVFDPKELSRERAVVLQEIGQANDTPDDIIFDHFQYAAFPDQPIGRPVLGLPEIVEKSTSRISSQRPLSLWSPVCKSRLASRRAHS